MSQIKRRDLLRWFGVGGAVSCLDWNPYRPFFEALTQGLIQKAHAQSTGIQAKNYVLFLQGGAPPRWCWDGFLNPSGLDANFVANGSVKNFVTSAKQGYTGITAEMIYKNSAAYNYRRGSVDKSIHLPALWDIPLPYYDGSKGIVDANSPLMRSYLQHAMIIRGVNMGVDIGHVRGPELVSMPSPSKRSLTGAVAETNRGKFPAIGIAPSAVPYLGYKSTMQIPIAISRGGGVKGPLFDFLEPFLIAPAGSLAVANKTNEALMEAAMDQALLELKAYATVRRPGSEILYDTLNASKSMFQDVTTKFGDVVATYNAILARYKAVVAASKTAFPGMIPTPVDLTSHRDHFSVGFAVAEFMIKNGLSTSFSFSMAGAMGVGKILNDSGVSKDLMTYNDEHTEADRQASAINCHFTYRSFMACLHLFRQNIGESAWNNTVVQLASEYGRTPRTDGTGTDHAPGANVATVFSGAIKQFIPIGNIAKSNSNGNPGTWGYKAATPIQGISSPIEITNAMAANTIGALLGVGKIIDTAGILIEPDSTNGWVSKAGDPENV